MCHPIRPHYTVNCSSTLPDTTGNVHMQIYSAPKQKTKSCGSGAGLNTIVVWHRRSRIGLSHRPSRTENRFWYRPHEIESVLTSPDSNRVRHQPNRIGSGHFRHQPNRKKGIAVGIDRLKSHKNEGKKNIHTWGNDGISFPGDEPSH